MLQFFKSKSGFHTMTRDSYTNCHFKISGITCGKNFTTCVVIATAARFVHKLYIKIKIKVRMYLPNIFSNVFLGHILGYPCPVLKLAVRNVI